MNIKIVIFTIFLLSFSLFVSHKVYATNDACGVLIGGGKNFCETGNSGNLNGGSCSYSCSSQGYWCTPQCGPGNVASCPTGATCEPVTVQCPRCGNSSQSCFRILPTQSVTPTITPTPTRAQLPRCSTSCRQCQAGDSCNSHGMCRWYDQVPNEPECIDSNGAHHLTNNCLPDEACQPNNTPVPTANTPAPTVPAVCRATPPNIPLSCGTCHSIPGCIDHGNGCCEAPPAPPIDTPTPGSPNCQGHGCHIGVCTPHISSCSCESGESCNSGECGGGTCTRNGTHRTDPFVCMSCGNPTPVPASPTPSYIPVQNFSTPTPKPTDAAHPTSQTWTCLHSAPYAGHDIYPDGVHNDHVLTVNGANLPINKPIYIVGCVLDGDNIKCTTGNSNLDNALGIQASSNHHFAVAGGPTITAAVDHTISVVARSASDTTTTHSFYAVYNTDNGSDNNQSGNSLQYATFQNTSSGVTVKCLAVRWDPEGVVFDANSLEPLSQLKMLITHKDKQKVIVPGLINPLVTDLGGAYHFFVEAGTYFLSFVDTPFKIVPQSEVNPDYTKAYSEIYSPDTPIVETSGHIEHRDIAVNTGIFGPIHTDPVSISFVSVPNKQTHTMKFLGRVSHPLTLVSLRQNKKEVVATVADKLGFYETEVPIDHLEPGVNVIPYFTKIPLTHEDTKNQSFFEKIITVLKAPFETRSHAGPQADEGAASSILPSYIEGYVNDSTGKPISNAQIDLKLSMSDKVVFSTTTDTTGLLIIHPKDLPIFPFYIVVNKKQKVTIHIFMQENKMYLQKNQINLINGTKAGNPVL